MMKSILLCVAVNFVGWMGTSSVVAEDVFRPLFDGKTLDGWEQHGGKAKYRRTSVSLVIRWQLFGQAGRLPYDSMEDER